MVGEAAPELCLPAALVKEKAEIKEDAAGIVRVHVHTGFLWICI